MKTFRMKTRYKARQFDPLDKPVDVECRLFGKDKHQAVYFWVAPDGVWEGKIVQPGDWMVIDEHGSRHVVADIAFRLLYEEASDAGEGG